MNKPLILGVVTALIGTALSAPPAEASYVVTLTEQDGNVLASGSGAIDLTGLTLVTTGGSAIRIRPNPAAINIGLFAPTSIYTGPIVGPSNFGSGTAQIISSGTGDEVGLNTTSPFLSPPSTALNVPANYVSQTNLSGTATFTDQTFTTLRVTPGNYEWRWGSGPNQNFTLDIVPPAAVPEPATLGLMVLGLLGAGFAGRKRGS